MTFRASYLFSCSVRLDKTCLLSLFWTLVLLLATAATSRSQTETNVLRLQFQQTDTSGIKYQFVLPKRMTTPLSALPPPSEGVVSLPLPEVPLPKDAQLHLLEGKLKAILNVGATLPYGQQLTSLDKLPESKIWWIAKTAPETLRTKTAAYWKVWLPKNRTATPTPLTAANMLLPLDAEFKKRSSPSKLGADVYGWQTYATDRVTAAPQVKTEFLVEGDRPPQAQGPVRRTVITAAPNSTGTVTLAYPRLTLNEAQPYTFTFLARADKNRVINVRGMRGIAYNAKTGLQVGAEEPEQAGLEGPSELTPQWKKYVFVFFASGFNTKVTVKPDTSNKTGFVILPEGTPPGNGTAKTRQEDVKYEFRLVLEFGLENGPVDIAEPTLQPGIDQVAVNSIMNAPLSLTPADFNVAEMAIFTVLHKTVPVYDVDYTVTQGRKVLAQGRLTKQDNGRIQLPDAPLDTLTIEVSNNERQKQPYERKLDKETYGSPRELVLPDEWADVQHTQPIPVSLNTSAEKPEKRDNLTILLMSALIGVLIVLVGVLWFVNRGRMVPGTGQALVPSAPAITGQSGSSQTSPLTMPPAAGVAASQPRLTQTTIPPFPAASEETGMALQPRLLGVTGKYAGGQFTLSETAMDIGRELTNPISLAQDTSVSRRHATVEKQDGEYILTDNNSSNGTFVNGVRLNANTPHQLQSGDEIEIGSSKFRFQS